MKPHNAIKKKLGDGIYKGFKDYKKSKSTKEQNKKKEPKNTKEKS